MYYIVGLGNPGAEYDGTRHNTGRRIVEQFVKKNDFDEWKNDKKLKALTAKGEVDGEKVMAVLPETFMNKSGVSVKPLIKSIKGAEKLVVVYDDLDLPLGIMKISFGRGSGGHRGVESIIKALRTKDFPRIRVGVSPATPSGKLRKPSGEKAVIDFILGKFKKPEEEILTKISKAASEALTILITEGRERAMNACNT